MSGRVTSLVWLANFPLQAMKTIALKLADCANDDGEGIHPSVARFSRETGCAESTVREVIGAFRESGLVVFEREGTADDRNSVITLDLAALAKLAAVDHRNGTFTPPTHCMRPFETGVTRETKNGNRVPVTVWRIVPRGPEDPSVYDKVASRRLPEGAR